MDKNYAITSIMPEQKIINRAANSDTSFSLFLLITFLILALNHNLEAQSELDYYLSSTNTGVENEKHNDTEPPTVITKNINIKLNHYGKTILKPEDIDNGSYDNAGIDTMQLSKSDFSCSNLGKNIVTLTVTDVNGNSGSETAIVNLTDDGSSPKRTLKDTTIFIDQDLKVKGPDAQKYIWSTGDTTKNLFFPKNYLDLGYNIISLKMISKSGCKNSMSFMVNVKANPDSEMSLPEIKLYPNPTSGEITIERTGNSLMNVEIYCSDGKLYKGLQSSDQKLIVDIESANRGVFYFKIITTEITKTFKVIKR